MRSNLIARVVGILVVTNVWACGSPASVPGAQAQAHCPTTEQAANPCRPAPAELNAQLSAGLTSVGECKVTDVYVVAGESDGPPWQFISDRIHAPGMDGDAATRASASIDLNKDPLIVAVDFMAAKFSQWDYPQARLCTKAR